MLKTTLSFVAAATLVASVEANTLQLDPIVISASKTEQSLKDVTANIDVITAQELEERRYRSVLEALNSLPGISFTQSGGVGQQSSLFIRGFANKYSLLLIDGIRANDVSNFDGAFFDQLSLSDIERIEVIKGAQSGIWGADASAGVINIITKKARPHHIEAYTEAGSFGTQKFGTTLSHTIDKGDIKIGFDRVLNNGFSAAEPSKTNPLFGQRFDDLGWERDPYSATTLYAKLGINVTADDRFEWSHRYLTSSVDFDNTGADNTSNRNNFTQRFTNLSYAHKDSTHTLTIYGGQSEFERTYYGGYKGRTDEISINDAFKYNDNSTIVVGGTWQKFNLENVAGSSINKEYTGRSLFASNTNRFNSGSTILSETLRSDHYSVFGSKTTGKIGLKQYLGEASLSTNYGTAYKAPSLSDIYPPSSWWMVYNTDLKPENIHSFDITGSYKNFSLTYFYNTIKNMIAINDSWSQMININGTTTLQGYEAALKQPLGDTFMFSGTYSRLHTTDGNGKELARRPHETFKSSVDWYPSEQWHIGINGEYIGTRYDNNAKTVETGNYSVFGAVMNYTLNKNVDLYAKAENLFDRYYQTVDGFATAGRSGYIGIKINY